MSPRASKKASVRDSSPERTPAKISATDTAQLTHQLRERPSTGQGPQPPVDRGRSEYHLRAAPLRAALRCAGGRSAPVRQAPDAEVGAALRAEHARPNKEART